MKKVSRNRLTSTLAVAGAPPANSPAPVVNTNSAESRSAPGALPEADAIAKEKSDPDSIRTRLRAGQQHGG